MAEPSADNPFQRAVDPRSLRGVLVRNLVLYVVVLAWAVVDGWEVKDLAWSLWLTSLVLGFIPFAILAGLDVYHAEGIAHRLGKLLVVGLGFAAWSLIYGGLHYLFAGFLEAFVPLVGSGEGVDFGFIEMVREIVPRTVLAYWPMVVAGAWSCLGNWRRFVLYGRGIRMEPTDPESCRRQQELVEDNQPYRLAAAAIVRIMLVIPLLVLADVIGLAGWALYPILLLCFLPISELLPRRNKTRSN